MIGYTFAVVAAFVPSRGLRLGIALGLAVLYLVYVKRTLAAGQIGEDLDRLHLRGLLTEGERPFPAFGSSVIHVDEPPLWTVVTYDETDRGWRSVIATGSLEEITKSALDPEVAEAMQRVKLPFVDVYDSHPPLEFRFFGLTPDEVTGQQESGTGE